MDHFSQILMKLLIMFPKLMMGGPMTEGEGHLDGSCSYPQAATTHLQPKFRFEMEESE
jgi:hypothetical protein